MMKEKTLKKVLFLCISLCFLTQNAFSEIVIKCKNDANWGSVYLYAWDDSQNALLGAWPGKALSANSDGWYSQSFSQSSVNIIFNNGSGTQTGNIEGVTSSTCYNASSGTTTTCPPDPIPTPDYGGGAGTPSNPYIISTKAHLEDLSLAEGDWGKVFLVNAEINMSGASFASIGKASKPFTGTFDGGQKAISNLNAKNGLFAYTKNATISNVALTNVAISGGSSEVGALIGCAESTNIQKSYAANGNVQSSNGLVGGLIGVSKGSTIDGCFASANVTASAGICIGGFVGVSSVASTIKNSYAIGDVTGNTVAAIGGFVGKNEGNSTIEYCYATGDVNSAKSYSGGFAGANYATIKNSASATATISSTANYVAAFGGNNNSRNTSSNNITWSETAISANQSYGDIATASNKNKFLLQNDFFGNNGWNFTNAWVFNTEKYPALIGLENQVYPYPFDNIISGIDDKKVLEGVYIENNPFFDKIVIKGVSNIEKVTLFNSVGAVVSSPVTITSEGAEISGFGLTSGNYLLQILTEDGQMKVLKAIKK